MTGALLTLAFTGGLLAPVNPCGFALLPTYLAHAATESHAGLAARLARVMGTGAALAAGFAVTLSAAGLAISAGAHQLLRAAPQIGFGVGLLLALLGLLALFGVGPRLAIRLPSITVSRAARGPLHWALFGVGYAAASLACTFGVLLAVIAQAQASTGLAGQLWVFTAYAAGSVTLLLTLSAAAALAGAALGRTVRALGRWQARITAALLLVTGTYVAVYWWPAVTDSAPVGRGLPALDHWSARTATWLQTHTGTVAIAAVVATLAAATAAAAARLRRRTPAADPTTGPPDCCPPSDAQPTATVSPGRIRER